MSDHRARAALVRATTVRLRAAGVPSPEVDAAALVAHVAERLGGVDGCDGAVLDGLVARRAAREPLQLLLGGVTFRWVDLALAPGVFVPRPETEVVAGAAVDAAAAAPGVPLVLEPCTGSGAITCALLVEVPGVQVVATERDPAAVALARRNVADVLAAPVDRDRWRAGAGPTDGARAEVVAGDLLAPVDEALRGRVDVLVSNPPYLPAADASTWEPEVAEHDPHAALVGGPDGHEVVDALLAAAPGWLRPGGAVVVEVDDRRGADALDAAAAAGLVRARLVRDLTGRDRAVVAERR